MLNKYILGNYYTHILVSFWREINHLNAVHVTEFSKSVRLKPFKCSLCDRVFMKSYEEDTASMLNKYILGIYYTHILVSFLERDRTLKCSSCDRVLELIH